MMTGHSSNISAPFIFLFLQVRPKLTLGHVFQAHVTSTAHFRWLWKQSTIHKRPPQLKQENTMLNKTATERTYCEGVEYSASVGLSSSGSRRKRLSCARDRGQAVSSTQVATRRCKNEITTKNCPTLSKSSRCGNLSFRARLFPAEQRRNITVKTIVQTHNTQTLCILTMTVAQIYDITTGNIYIESEPPMRK